MSKKRKSSESSNDEQTLEGSDSAFQREGNTKRAKLDSLSDTTLQDLPVELIDCILVTAVAMEVKAMKLVKSVWKAKAEMVISRLRTVSLQWSSILSTNFFRNELHRTLDGYGPTGCAYTMSKKLKSPASSNDEQTLEGSDSVFQHEDNTKRAKLVSLSDTTMQNLPSEIIECILVRAVAMEVKAMKLAKSVWKEKADLVISRLRTVSLQWSSILSTNFFRNELHRTLDGHAQETIRWEILLQPSIHSFIMKLTSMKDEVFMLCVKDDGGYALNVYNRSNVVESKAVIPLSEFHLGDMAACNLSNCVYLLNANMSGPSVIRITKDERQFKASVWIKTPRLPVSDMSSISVSANGNLIILARQRSPEPTVVGIYDANGFVQNKLRLSPAILGQIDSVKHVSSVIQKSNGNLLLIVSSNIHKTKFLEIDVSRRIIREYQSSYRVAGVRCFEDIKGRILVNYPDNRIELLDSEFNLMDVAVPRLNDGEILSPYELHYNSERHEMVGFRHDRVTNYSSVLVTFRFTEE